MKLAKMFFEDIRGLILSARATVARGVDLVQVYTNFEIGRRIIVQEQKGKARAAYGKDLLNALSERLTGEFGNGFSRSNLEYMRRFFTHYHDRSQIAQSLTGKLELLGKSQPLTGILQSTTAKLPLVLKVSPCPANGPRRRAMSETGVTQLLRAG